MKSEDSSEDDVSEVSCPHKAFWEWIKARKKEAKATIAADNSAGEVAAAQAVLDELILAQAEFFELFEYEIVGSYMSDRESRPEDRTSRPSNPPPGKQSTFRAF